jgi:hypothetical protein
MIKKAQAGMSPLFWIILSLIGFTIIFLVFKNILT